MVTLKENRNLLTGEEVILQYKAHETKIYVIETTTVYDVNHRGETVVTTKKQARQTSISHINKHQKIYRLVDLLDHKFISKIPFNDHNFKNEYIIYGEIRDPILDIRIAATRKITSLTEFVLGYNIELGYLGTKSTEGNFTVIRSNKPINWSNFGNNFKEFSEIEVLRTNFNFNSNSKYKFAKNKLN